MLIDNYDYDDDEGISTQTHNLYLCNRTHIGVQGQCQQHQNEKCRLEKLKSIKLTEDSLKSDEGHVKFYTGLPSSILNGFFRHISPHGIFTIKIPAIPYNPLTKFK